MVSGMLVKLVQASTGVLIFQHAGHHPVRKADGVVYPQTPSYRLMNRLPLLVLFILLPACTHVRTANSDDRYAEINQRSEREPVTVWLTNGVRFRTERLHIASDVTTWYEYGTVEVQRFPTDEIARVEFKSRGRGALEGLGIGLVVGAITGFAFDFASGQQDEENIIQVDDLEEDVAIVLGVLWSSLGGLIGLPIGAVVGSKDVYPITP